MPREDLGTWGRGGGPAKVPCQMEMDGAGGSQAPGRVLPGDSGLRPPPWLRVFLGLQRPLPPRGGQPGPSPFNSLKSELNHAPRERDRCYPGPPELQPPPREGIRGLLSMVSANGIHLPRTRPHGRSLGKPQEPLGPDPGISRGLLRGPGALSDPGSARPDPRITAGHLHSAMSGLRPPWGWDTWGRGASNRPTWRETRRPLRLVPTTVKIPLFFHP